MLLLFKNQCMKLPSGGIIFGYFFVSCAAFCSADSWGPGYLGASARSRRPWEGGLNLVGFSRTRGLELLLELLEALRMSMEALEGCATRVRHIAPPCGNRNRGMEAVGGIVSVFGFNLSDCSQSSNLSTNWYGDQVEASSLYGNQQADHKFLPSKHPATSATILPEAISSLGFHPIKPLTFQTPPAPAVWLVHC